MVEAEQKKISDDYKKDSNKSKKIKSAKESALEENISSKQEI